MRNNKATITLTTVLIITVVLLYSGIALLYAVIDLRRANQVNFEHTLAQLRFQNCLEESLYKLTKNLSYTGNFTITFSDGECSSTVATTANVNIKSINILSTYKQVGYNKITSVDISSAPPTITNN